MGPKTQERPVPGTPDGSARSGYAVGMRLALALVALAAVPLKAEEPLVPSWALSAGRPAFGAAQAAADGAYAVASGRILAPLLPEGLAARLDAAPDADSYDAFARRLRARQERAVRRDLESRPAADASSPAAMQAWSRDVAAAHRDALLDAYAATMAERYRLRRLGRAAGDFARDPSNWSPDFLAPAAVLGGAYAYLAGVRADFPWRGLDLAVDLAPGARLRAAAEGGGAGRLARVAVSPRGSPLAVYGEWSARAPERVGASWSRRF